ncbi:uncharacterized protein LY89DRAFT_776131 [Mollisia scopiformis]|uniref:Uncharacterized protein n=1 Tax=Mollisia scopiformis TaxID=149040 RepID=A0A194XV78_MOLSC|nr:uncharacterized protein LY89DRAFT_776131 [Mollisia scopiformis]KUJ23924.1 hypothetical protein LY89DRAFT_776131 [Mollisia scopiformis]
MATDLFSLCLFLAAVLKLGGTLHAAPYEIDVYQEIIALIVDNFKRVKLIRKTTSCSRYKGLELDAQLQKIEDVLKKARRAVSWIPRDMNGNSDLGPREFVAWTLTWKKVADAHQELLRMCSIELAELKIEMAELDQASKRHYPETIFFEQVRQQTWTILCDRAKRNASLYVGPGDQLSRSIADNVMAF